MCYYIEVHYSPTLTIKVLTHFNCIRFSRRKNIIHLHIIRSAFVTNNYIFNFFHTSQLGIEPRFAVLETAVLPAGRLTQLQNIQNKPCRYREAGCD
jgi:hypothetical protein